MAAAIAAAALSLAACGRKPPAHARWKMALGEGSSIAIDVDFSGASSSWKVESEWRKSSLMPVRAFRVKADAHATAAVLDAIRKAGPADGVACTLEVEPWPGKNESVACAPLSGALHASWFTARHLNLAGLDAESVLDAKYVKDYYADGIAMLGTGGSSPIWVATTGQIEEAGKASGEGRDVDAVVLLRNALRSRLDDQAARLMKGMEIADMPDPGPRGDDAS